MFLLDWFYWLLTSLGLYKKEANILLLGLENDGIVDFEDDGILGLVKAGKITFLRMLNNERLVHHRPTEYPTSGELSIGNIKFKVFDRGGYQIAPRVWKDYYAKELCALLSDEWLANVPILILGNKVDILPCAAPEFAWALTCLTTGKGKVNLADTNVRPLEVFMCSSVRDMERAFDGCLSTLSRPVDKEKMIVSKQVRL